MAVAGLFDDCDIALMTHPLDHYEKSGKSLAMDAVQFEFFGKSAHTAASPMKVLITGCSDPNVQATSMRIANR
jgi:metal-dependent amidase/aminoacylase/carboxypeptidase family protein